MKVLTDNQHYKDIAEAILAKTGSTTPLKPAEMAPALNNLNIELEETFVTSTEEEQVIYPDEGYYGFSKITVGAVDLSSGDGGGIGGGGTVESYPDAESTTFGCEYVTEAVPTGRVKYGNLTLNAFPKKYPYQIISYYNNMYYVAQFDSVPVINGGYYKLSQDYNYAGYRYNSSTGTWGGEYLTSYSAGVTYPINGNIRWANFTLLYADGTVHTTGSAPIPETTEAVVSKPLDREETYEISGSTLNSLGTVIQQITGAEATTPSGMIAALQSYANVGTESTE